VYTAEWANPTAAQDHETPELPDPTMTAWYTSLDLRLPVAGRPAVDTAAKTLRGEEGSG
jgi:hypothetical protein